MKSIREDIWSIWQINLHAREHYLYSWYFYSPETKEEINYLKRSMHFLFLRESILKVCIIELCKLLNKSANDQFNLYDFFDGLEKGLYGEHRIDTSIINQWRKSLNSHSKTIEKIKRIRKKAYAHTDKNFDIKKEELSFKAIRELIETIEVIIKDVYNIELESDALMGAPCFESSKFDILKVLATATKI